MSTWEQTADAYRRSFETLCAGTHERLLDDAAGGVLLDVGCGTGVLAAAAEGSGRRVIAVDADPDMLTRARDRGLRDVRRAQLPRLPLSDGNVDTAVANFVINHVGEPAASVAELARVVRVGGTVALTIWPAGASDWMPLLGEVFATTRTVPPPSTHLPEHLDFARTTEGLAGLATSAGLTVEVATELAWTWTISPDDLWCGITGGVGTAGATYLAQSPEVRTRIGAEFARRSTTLADTDGFLRFPSHAAYVLARRAAS